MRPAECTCLNHLIGGFDFAVMELHITLNPWMLCLSLVFFNSPLSISCPLFRVSSAGPSRRTSIQLTPVNMKAAASSTRSPATSASCAALRSASLWAWLWTVSYYKLVFSYHYQFLQRDPWGWGCHYATVEDSLVAMLNICPVLWSRHSWSLKDESCSVCRSSDFSTSVIVKSTWICSVLCFMTKKSASAVLCTYVDVRESCT